MKRITLIMIILIISAIAAAENVDPYDADEQYAWGENVGWLNFEPSLGDGMHVQSDKVTGWVWSENVGWVNLHCENNATCATAAFGVVNDGAGNLSGFAWGENIGWVNFDPDVPGDPENKYRVRIDAEGVLSGWAWGENIGWIRFDRTQTWSTRVCIVTLEDMTNFAAYWLDDGVKLRPAELDGFKGVNMGDFNVFSSYWQDYCPDGWRLK